LKATIVEAEPHRSPAERPHTLISHGDLHPDDAQIAQLLPWIREAPRGVIIAGPNAAQGSPDPFHRLSRATGYPILAEPTSGLRFDSAAGEVIAGYNLFPLDGELSAPDIILQFGDVPTSNPLLAYLSSVRPRHRVLITRTGEWRDDQHSLTALMQADPALVCDVIADRLKHLTDAGEYSPDLAWRDRLRCLEQIAWQTVADEIGGDEYFDGGVVYDVIDLLPAESSLFAGNSLPIRHLDQFGRPVDRPIHVYANRGTSGIDGNISTALGIGAARPYRPLVAIVGDVTFYHDMNGLLAVRRCGVPVTIVLLNNNGGGIFHRLPIRDYDPAFTEYFVTPHGLDFSHAARLYGLDYVRADSRAEFREVFSARVGTEESTIIEVFTDAKTDLARRSAIMQTVADVTQSR
jgi:2-succinyl-5-enolpyruvyl-6-hydroxy-3-cyclohexene-1-carboxylate synthase